jgi:hypothetical protein
VARIEIAGVRLRLDDGQLSAPLRARLHRAYGGFADGGGDPDYSIEFDPTAPPTLSTGTPTTIVSREGKLVVEGAESSGFLDLANGRGRVQADPQLFLLDLFVRAAISLGLERRGGCLFHSAAVIVDGLAYLFPGRSGAGKTTLASQAGNPLCDEICAVVPADGALEAHATPWWRGKAAPAPLAGVFELSWNGECVTPLSPAAGLRHLAANQLLAVDTAERRRSAFETAGRIAAAVPFGRFDFTPQTQVDALLRGLRERA